MREWSTLRKLMLLKGATGAPLREYTATGNPLKFNTNKAKPLKSLTIPWTPSQVGSGDPSPTNVRPISGVSALNVWQTGKNLFKTTATSKEDAGVTYTVNSDGTVTVSGTATGYSSLALGTIDIPSSGKITISGIQDTTNIRWQSISLRTADNVEIADLTTSSINPLTVNLDSYQNARKLYLAIKRNSNVETSGTVKPMVNTGETTLPYAPYTGTTKSIVFPALGKNLFDKSKVTTGVWWKGKVLTGGTYDDYSASDYIPVTEGQTYTLTRTVSGQGAVCYFDSEKTYVSQETWDQYIPSHQIPDDIAYITFTTLTTGLDTAQFEQGSSASAYEPYTNTVYGGSLDIVSGVLTVEWWKYSTKWGDMDFGADIGSYTRKTYSISRTEYKLKNGASNSICNVTNTYLNSNTNESNHYYISSTGWTFYLILPTETDADTYVEFAGIMYDPIVVATLTPIQITALLGDNTIWSDTNGTNTAIYFKKG